jgi:endonuclease-3 related protein
MLFESSSQLIEILYSLGYPNRLVDEWWWPESGTFRVVEGAILTQNSRWERVEKSLENLSTLGLLNPEAVAECDLQTLSEAIRPSGFHKNKAMNLKSLSTEIVERFGDFENFRQSVGREWLLQRRGIGPETADSILNYCCYREVFVVDSYTARLLHSAGYELDGYEEIAQWMVSGLSAGPETPYGDIPRARGYALAHGAIVEYCKEHRKGRGIDIEPISRFISDAQDSQGTS